MSTRIFKFGLLVFLWTILAHCGFSEEKDFVQQGIERTNREDYTGAAESFLKAIEQNPRNSKAYYGLGGIYNYQNKLDEAEQAFETTLKLDPTNYDAIYSLGFTYELMGRKKEAEEKYQRSREMKARMQALLEPGQNSR
jgi:Tfp pilus assembly protein PilF